MIVMMVERGALMEKTDHSEFVWVWSGFDLCDIEVFNKEAGGGVFGKSLQRRWKEECKGVREGD